MLRIKLDDELIAIKDHSDLNETEIVIRRKDDEGRNAIGFSEEISFYGRAYEILKEKLIDTGGNTSTLQNESVKIEVFSDCCSSDQSILYIGRISYLDIEWCSENYKDGECFIKATSEEDTENAGFLRKLQNTIMSRNIKWPDGVWFWERGHPFILYCIRPSPGFIQDLGFFALTWLNVIFSPILIMIFSLMAVATGLVEAMRFAMSLFDTLTGLPLGIGAVFDVLLFPITTIFEFAITLFEDILNITFDGEQNLLTSLYNETLGRLAENIVGCKRGYYSPFLRDYAINIALQAGLNGVSSSIFMQPNDPYYRTTWWEARSTKGVRWRRRNRFCSKINYFQSNAPLNNGIKFLNEISKVFNATWWVQDRTLYIEPKSNRNILFDFSLRESTINGSTKIDPDNIINLCFEYSDEKLYSYARFEYIRDPYDTLSDVSLIQYNDIVDYNPTASELRAGEKTVTLIFSGARFVNDQLDGSNHFGEWRKNFITRSLFFFNPNNFNYDLFMMLEKGLAQNPKLLLIEPGAEGNQEGAPSIYDDARVVSVKPGVNINTGNVENVRNAQTQSTYFNYPLWFNDLEVIERINDSTSNQDEIRNGLNSGLSNGLFVRGTQQNADRITDVNGNVVNIYTGECDNSEDDDEGEANTEKATVVGADNIYSRYWIEDHPLRGDFLTDKRVKISFLYECEDIDKFVNIPGNAAFAFSDKTISNERIFVATIQQISFRPNGVATITGTVT